MATERQLHFRVGLLVLTACAVCVGLVVRFGDTQQLLKKRYPLLIRMENSGGLYSSAPVTLSGLAIGSVKRIDLNQQQGGVDIHVEVQQEIRLPIDTRAVIARSLMGDASVEFIAGQESELLKPGGSMKGVTASDPLSMIQRLETRTLETLGAFADTGQEWQLVAKNINRLMTTERGNLNQIVEAAADSLHEFTQTMKNANQMLTAANEVVGDPAAQKAIKETLTSLPKLVSTTKTTIDETRQVVTATRQVLDSMNRNLVNLSQVTEPVGKRGEQMVAKLDSSLSSIDLLLTEMTRFARVINQKDGSLQRFVSDPSLYDNLERSSQSVAILIRNLEPVMRDLREFSDKVARNPELLGVGGAVRPSPGLKDEEIPQKRTGIPHPVARGKAPN